MNTSIFDQRRAGLLIPVYALRRPDDLGIGDTLATKEAIDFCAEHGFSVLQVLPIQETIGDHSPYSPISSRALSPALLTLKPEFVPGLTQSILDSIAPAAWSAELRKGNVDHSAVHSLKNKILAAAAEKFFASPKTGLWQDFLKFQENQADWLQPYALFRTLIDFYEGNTQFLSWQPDHQTYDTASEWLQQQADRQSWDQKIQTFNFIQWVAWRQWSDVHAHASAQNIKLLGELTFGVSATGSDAWANPTLFDPAWHLGTRPLAHFDTNKDAEAWGQNWGLPSYRWENHRASGFKWLRGRIIWQKQFFHGTRLDHLRGYFRAYMFPWAGGVRHVEFSNLNEQEAALRTGGLLPRFVPGPDDNPLTAEMNRLQGIEIIGQLIDEAGDLDMVAEIMGEMPGYMTRTLDELQLANLRFPQLERTADGNIIPPDSFRKLGLISYANHDNAPLAMLYQDMLNAAIADQTSKQAADLQALLSFTGWKEPAPPEITSELLEHFQRALFETSSLLAVLMCSDLLGIPLRFNLPGSYGENTWSDRLPMTLNELKTHAVYGSRIATAARLVHASERNAGL